MTSRVRFSIDAEAGSRAKQYAKDTHRNTTEMICEALEQLQARYPKRPHGTQTDLDALASKVAAILRLHVPAGTLQGNFWTGYGTFKDS